MPAYHSLKCLSCVATIMSFNRDPVSSVYLEHVLETREGAHGATGAVGGGCGCN